MACSMITPPSRSTSAVSLATSLASAAVCLRRPGWEAVNAAIAPSLATRRNVAIVVRSTPASAAASLWEIWPVSVRTHRSYFCSGDKNRFGRLVEVILILLKEDQRPCQMRSENPRILSREVSGKAAGGPRRRTGVRW